MQIVCTTTSAAAQVLTILQAAHLRPVLDFEIHPLFSGTPPITYTIYSPLTEAQITRIRTVTDTSIVE